MSQTSVIAGSLVIAFIVFITVRGQLPCYLEVLGISTAGQCAVSCAGTSGGTSGIRSVGSGGIAVQSPAIGIGPVTVQPPVIRV